MISYDPKAATPDSVLKLLSAKATPQRPVGPSVRPGHQPEGPRGLPVLTRAAALLGGATRSLLSGATRSLLGRAARLRPAARRQSPSRRRPSAARHVTPPPHAVPVPPAIPAAHAIPAPHAPPAPHAIPAPHAPPAPHAAPFTGIRTTTGLTATQVRERQRQFGPNVLPAHTAPPFWRRFLDQFKDLGTVVLIIGTILSALSGRVTETIVVGGITLVGAMVGAWRSGQQDQVLTALAALTPPHATVVREGAAGVIPADELVPGDVVLLRSGDRVPADLIALSGTPDLEVQASTPSESVLPAGSEVVRGRARGVVVATGDRTQIGRIARTIGQVDRLPSRVERRMAALGRDLLKVALFALGGVLLAGLVWGLPSATLLENGIAMVTAAVPEGLPTVVTLAMAAGARRLARRGAYVRDLAAAESVGSVDVICADKTGTFTRREMTVRSIFAGGHWWTVTGIGFDPTGQFLKDGVPHNPLEDLDLRAFLEIAVSSSNASLVEGPEGGLEVMGSQTEGALLVLARKAGLSTEKGRELRLREEPFDPIRRRMTVTLGLPGDTELTYSKGAPEVILARCSHELVGGELRPLDAQGRATLERVVHSMTANAYRVLALAYALGEQAESGHIFAGLAGITDPPRSEIRPVLRKCERMGIRTVMLTGDHPETAATVARDLGLLPPGMHVLTGDQLERLDDRELSQMIGLVSVFARVAPEQKARVIRALQHRGHTVGYIGEGLDDVPALRAADIGFAPQERGTDIAREAATVVLTDDRFEAVVSAIEQGRGTGENVGEIARYLLTVNTAELLVMLGAALFGMPLPLLALQLLWLNLIADSPAALALGEQHTRIERSRGPASHQSRQALRREILTHGLEMGVAVFGLYATALAGGVDLATARTMAMSAIGASQIFYLFRCRTEMGTPCGIWLPKEPVVTLAAAISALLLVATHYLPPVAAALGTVPLSFPQWLAVLGTALAGNLSAVVNFTLGRMERPGLPVPV